jgi:hypothetical protein
MIHKILDVIRKFSDFKYPLSCSRGSLLLFNVSIPEFSGLAGS